MIAISIDDSACIARGSNDRQHAISSDAIWTGSGWIVADMDDAPAMLEAQKWAALGELVGLREAMQLPVDKRKDFNRLHYLAALFKRAAEALRNLGEPETKDVVIAIPSAPVCWRGYGLATGARTFFHFNPDHPELRRDFERAAQIAGFQRVFVRPAALALADRFQREAKLEKKASVRLAAVEVFRTGVSVTPVVCVNERPEMLGRPLFVDCNIEKWMVESVCRATSGAVDPAMAELASLLRTATISERPVSVNGLKDAKPQLLQLARPVIEFEASAADTLMNLVGLSRERVKDFLADPRTNAEYTPLYPGLIVSGWLSVAPIVRGAFEEYLKDTLRLEDSVNRPNSWDAEGLKAAAEGAALAAQRDKNWLTSGTAESLYATRGVDGKTPNEKAKTTGDKEIFVPGNTRPAIGRLSWLLDNGSDHKATVTLSGSKTESRFNVTFQPQGWETRARVEAEVTIEHDDRVCLTTLIDGRPVTAVVTAAGNDRPIEAIAPGRFELYLNDEHQLITEITRGFEHGRYGVVAPFVATAAAGER